MEETANRAVYSVMDRAPDGNTFLLDYPLSFRDQLALKSRFTAPDYTWKTVPSMKTITVNSPIYRLAADPSLAGTVAAAAGLLARLAERCLYQVRSSRPLHRLSLAAPHCRTTIVFAIRLVQIILVCH